MTDCPPAAKERAKKLAKKRLKSIVYMWPYIPDGTVKWSDVTKGLKR